MCGSCEEEMVEGTVMGEESGRVVGGESGKVVGGESGRGEWEGGRRGEWEERVGGTVVEGDTNGEQYMHNHIHTYATDTPTHQTMHSHT